MTLAEVAAERQRIEARRKRRAEVDKADRQRLYDLDQLELRLKLVPLVGVAGGVRVAARVSPSDPAYKLNHLVGKLESLARTWAHVDFGEAGGKWRFRFRALVPAGGNQGVTIDAMVQGDMPDDPRRAG